MITPAKTPGRSNDESVGGDLDRPASKIGAAWTTGRCNRLLRPIASRLLLLRKEQSHSSVQQETRPPPPISPEKPPHDLASSYGDSGSASKKSKSPYNDPDWVPFAARRRLKRKYGASGYQNNQQAGRRQKTTKLNHQRRSLPGEISISTPLISRRADRFQQEDEGSQHARTQLMYEETDGHVERAELPRKPSNSKQAAENYLGLTPHVAQLQRLKKDADSSHANLIGGLCTSFETLIKATAPSIPQVGKGTRSLFATCLRKVPARILVEEEWREETDDYENADVSAVIYTELEDFGSAAGQGWRPLREVTAIADGTVSQDVIHVCVTTCVRHKAFDEAEELLASFVAIGQCAPPPASFKAFRSSKRPSPCLGMVKSYADQSGRKGFEYRQLTFMIESGRLPVEWLATAAFRSIWNHLVRSVSDQDQHHQDAVRFMRATVDIACGLHGFNSSLEEETTLQELSEVDSTDIDPEISTALTNTFSSLATILTTIALVSQSEIVGAGNDAETSLITYSVSSLAVDVLRGNDLSDDVSAEGDDATIHDTASDRAYVQRKFPLLISALLLRFSKCRLWKYLVDIDVEACLRYFTDLRTCAPNGHELFASAAGGLPSFICSIARCCGRAFRDDGFSTLQKLVQALVSCPTTVPGGALFLHDVATNSAMEFAQLTESAEHLTFARTFQQSVRDSGVLELSTNVAFKSNVVYGTPAKANGFRWEEGICEWIAITPVVAPQFLRHLRRKQQSPLVHPPPQPEDQCSSPTSIDDVLRLGLGGTHDFTPSRSSLSSTMLSIDLDEDGDDDDDGASHSTLLHLTMAMRTILARPPGSSSQPKRRHSRPRRPALRSIPIRSTSTTSKIEDSPDTSFPSPTSQTHRAPDLALRSRKTSASLKRHPSSTSLLGSSKLLDSDDEDELSMSEFLSRKEAPEGRSRSRASIQPRGYATLRRSARSSSGSSGENNNKEVGDGKDRPKCTARPRLQRTESLLRDLVDSDDELSLL
ncbi:hypothetical protein LTR39_001081 [Cryomyces antarcticus]|nr:hypothetical protein LTR39_001081 [Cryomyces antarcticus]